MVTIESLRYNTTSARQAADLADAATLGTSVEHPDWIMVSYKGLVMGYFRVFEGITRRMPHDATYMKMVPASFDVVEAIMIERLYV